MMLAQTAGEFAAGGGVFGAIIVLARIFERFWDKRRNGKAIENENLPYFRATDRATLGKVAEVCGRTDSVGRPLIYTPPEFGDLLRKQTEILADMREFIRRQAETLDRRVRVCEKHTDILRDVSHQMKETRP